MIYSMTGFSSTTFIVTTTSGEKSSISINLKTLNSRFFETTIKLPLCLSPLETEFIKQLKHSLKRGHIYLTINLSNQNLFESNITPSFTTIAHYIEAIEHIKKEYAITNPITLDNILRLPNIFSKEELALDEQSTSLINNAVESLIKKVILDRQSEGMNLSKDLYQRIAIIQQEMNVITQRAHIFVAESKKKILDTLQEIGADENLIINAQKNGLYAMLDKIDIHEEITRLTSHLENLTTQLKSQDIEKGKRLDFILQELGREINTIAAKCSDSTISSHAINVKVEIEKMREQIQNIV
jgi:uncharacterized protein (TIGR00255 family)